MVVLCQDYIIDQTKTIDLFHSLNNVGLAFVEIHVLIYVSFVKTFLIYRLA